MLPIPNIAIGDALRHKRAVKALERQLVHQQRKAIEIQHPRAKEIYESAAMGRAKYIRGALGQFRPLSEDASVLEVGSGAHGVAFFLEQRNAVGVDPLAQAYRSLFPGWQSRCSTYSASGEALPFEDASFDYVISDNVVDHAGDPKQIVGEMMRVLKPSGLFFFSVNIHHKIYDIASRLYGALLAARAPIEIATFADHTVHLTPRQVRKLFRDLPIATLQETIDMLPSHLQARHPRHALDRIKHFFYKNALYELIGQKDAWGPS